MLREKKIIIIIIIIIIINNFSVFVSCWWNVVLARYVRSHPVHLLGAKPPLSLKPSDAPVESAEQQGDWGGGTNMLHFNFLWLHANLMLSHHRWRGKALKGESEAAGKTNWWRAMKKFSLAQIWILVNSWISSLLNNQIRFNWWNPKSGIWYTHVYKIQINKIAVYLYGFNMAHLLNCKASIIIVTRKYRINQSWSSLTVTNTSRFDCWNLGWKHWFLLKQKDSWWLRYANSTQMRKRRCLWFICIDFDLFSFSFAVRHWVQC